MEPAIISYGNESGTDSVLSITGSENLKTGMESQFDPNGYICSHRPALSRSE